MEELKFLEEWHVWDVRPTSECWAKPGKPPIGGRWVDHNKGDEDSPKVRSRYVAKDIARWRDGAMFAATPPTRGSETPLVGDGHPPTGPARETGLWARSGKRRGQRKAMVIDVSKAHLHAFVNRNIYVSLPLEEAQPGIRAKLARPLYGTRDAPARWEALYAQTLHDLGVERGRARAC